MSSMPPTQSTTGLVVDYLSGEISVRELRVRMARVVLEAEATDLRTRRLAYEVEHRLAEFTNGDWSEDELRGMLRRLVSRNYVLIDEAPRPRSPRPRPGDHWTRTRTRSLAESA